jgi:uncharacterized protein (TIGR02246 family)
MTRPSASVSAHEEEGAIRAVEAVLREAWNSHDAKAWAKLCAEDADVVNVVGWWWQGRAQIEQKIAESHRFLFRESTLTHDEIRIRFLTADTAVVHIRWSMVGGKNPDGTPGQPRKGIETQVLRKLGGKWLIAAFHNTDSRPEVPFPVGPPKR